MKSEPETWSWEQQKKKKVEHWDGVRNYQAANYMKQMKKGDECLFYSSVSEKAIKGIMTVRWNLEPGDVLYCDCTSLKADKQFKAGLRWFKKNSEWAVDYDNKIFFWHRPPYFYDPLWKTHIITGIVPANPLQSMESNHYGQYLKDLAESQGDAS